MDDQNQQDQIKPKITPEEELNVLEAVWKIGEEKGLKLLRPEQIKKLTDAGRLEDKIKPKLESKPQGKLDLNKIDQHVDIVIQGLLLDAENEGKKLYEEKDWETMNQMDKFKIRFSMFVSLYRLSPESMKTELLKRMMKDEIYG